MGQARRHGPGRQQRSAVDLIEHAETATRYEHMNLRVGGHAEGLSSAELHTIVDSFGGSLNALLSHVSSAIS